MCCIGIWHYVRENRAFTIFIQDHKILGSEANKKAIRNSALGIIPGAANAATSISPGHLDARGNRVGGTSVTCWGSLSRYKCEAINDERGWGRWSVRIIKKQKNMMVQKTCIALASVYCPCESTTGKNTMWNYQSRMIMDKVPVGQRHTKNKDGVAVGDPRGQFCADFKRMMRAVSKKHNCHIIVMGDVNIDLNTSSPERVKLLDWAEGVD